MGRGAIITALAAVLSAFSCGDRDKPPEITGDRPPPITGGESAPGIDQLKPDRMALVLTRRQGRSSLLAVVSVTARQQRHQEMAEGSDSARIVLHLSSGRILESPAIGEPRYQVVSGRGPVYRLAVWRWAWHSMADTCLMLSDSSATIDSAWAFASWWSRGHGRRFETSATGVGIPVSLSHRRLD
ncbi:MAG TPA: hypothetical protein DDW31_01575 [candidate division Zixibacteria bacterium]|jgi:hypothetical protein|nr:hypothetical protein [candidate division Zixibacteria bacterium]